jgi:hypothetical protein
MYFHFGDKKEDDEELENQLIEETIKKMKQEDITNFIQDEAFLRNERSKNVVDSFKRNIQKNKQQIPSPTPPSPIPPPSNVIESKAPPAPPSIVIESKAPPPKQKIKPKSILNKIKQIKKEIRYLLF